MRSRSVRRLLPLLGILGLLAMELGCAKAPPNITPQATQAFHKTNVLNGLDLARDFAIDAEATDPKVLSTATTRKIVTYHQSSVRIMQASDAGWREAVMAALDELLGQLSPAERQKFGPYAGLIKSLVQEIH